jgi:hypothetical protein
VQGAWAAYARRRAGHHQHALEGDGQHEELVERTGRGWLSRPKRGDAHPTSGATRWGAFGEWSFADQLGHCRCYSIGAEDLHEQLCVDQLYPKPHHVEQE